jgi:hypothetical protein
MADELKSLIEWIRDNPAVLWWSGTLSLVMFVASLLAVPLILVKMPEDYFLQTPPDDWRAEYPVLRWGGRILKNVTGLVLVIVGVALLVLPGQGLLTIFLGITLINFPGKRRVEMALLRRPGASRAVNWLREKYGRPPLQIPPRRRLLPGYSSPPGQG